MPTPRAADGMGHPLRSHATDTSRLEDAVAVNLLPTPVASEHKGRRENPSRQGGASLTDTLLPTPSTLDSIEARTTYGGGNPTLQGAVGGVSDVDAARHERAGRLLPTPVVTDSFGARNETSGRKEGSKHHSGRTLGDVTYLDAWGEYGPAVARWERVLGRRAPNPTEPGKNRPRLASRFVEWLMGLDDGHVTGVGLTRNQELKALGNGVVVQQGAAALRHLDQIRRTS